MIVGLAIAVIFSAACWWLILWHPLVFVGVLALEFAGAIIWRRIDERRRRVTLPKATWLN
jgi:hypothetical protein